MVEAWIDSEDTRVISDLPEYPDWWSVFGDATLNELIRLAHEQNLSLREAGWRVMQARSQRAIAAGNLFPQSQQGFGEYDRILGSQNVAAPAPFIALDQWSTGATLAWELDFWGRYRRAIASADADAEVEASVGDYARNNVKIQQGSLQLSQDQADLGSTSYTGVSLAKSSMAATQATIPSLEIGLRQANNQLCTLPGLPTHDLAEMLGDGDIPTTPTEVLVLPFAGTYSTTDASPTTSNFKTSDSRN